MSLNSDAKAKLIKNCGELSRLPPDWSFSVVDDRGSKRVVFEKNSTQIREYKHPNLGALPAPWILRVVTDKASSSMTAEYYNRETQKSSTRDPRFTSKALADQKKNVPRVLAHTAAFLKNRTGLDITKMRRAPIQDHDIRGHYEIAHTIDAGDGTLGAMNGGVFVVRIKNIPNHMYVEKRFKNDKDAIQMAVAEIRMLERVKHPALTFYIAAFILPDLSDASVWVEFCDRGSLEDLIKAYSKRSNLSPQPLVPEAFIWHFFTGLCDGLAYLQGGSIFFRNKNAAPEKGWIPILHRDIKPDNILIRSRSTVSSKRYFYCVLSDFGLACEDHPRNDERVDQWQHDGLKLGTKSYWAPELLWNPYPKDSNQRLYYPNGGCHSARSDLWALGATVFNLCTVHQGNYSHLDSSTLLQLPKGSEGDWFEGTISHYKKFVVPKNYSTHLRDALQKATEWELRKRPDPISMVKVLEKGLLAAGAQEQGDSEAIPDWATRVHAYHHKS